jgi:anti-anti-sigma regulatory factor
MPAYRVYVQQIIDGHVDVEAVDADTARLLAYDLTEAVEQDGESDFIVIDAEQIEEV